MKESFLKGKFHVVCRSNRVKAAAVLPILATLFLTATLPTYADDPQPPPCPTCVNLGYDYSNMVGVNTPQQYNADGSEASMTLSLGPDDAKISYKKEQLINEYRGVLAGTTYSSTFTADLATLLSDIGEDPEQHHLGNYANCTDGTTTCQDAMDGTSTQTISSPAAGMTNWPISGVIGALQQTGEVTGAYCGPAAAWSILRGLNVTTSHYGEPLLPASTGQHTLAALCSTCGDPRGKYLQTDYFGQTPWVAEAGNYPMPRALNRWRTGYSSGWYNVKTVTNDAAGRANFKTNLTLDINIGYPIAANIVEYTNGVHLPGHPNFNIYHWIALRGYNNYGDNTRYADPAYSAYVTWGYGTGMMPYNSVLTDSVMVPLISRRGYVY